MNYKVFKKMDKKQNLSDKILPRERLPVKDVKEFIKEYENAVIEIIKMDVPIKTKIDCLEMIKIRLVGKDLI